MLSLLIVTAAVAIGIALMVGAHRARQNGAMVRRFVLTNAGVFLVAVVLLVTLSMGVFAAEPAATGAAVQAASNDRGMGFLAAALATGLSCIGAGIAIASTAPAAIGAFSEDPKSFGKALIFVVLGEGIALYGLLVSILIINALG